VCVCVCVCSFPLLLSMGLLLHLPSFHKSISIFANVMVVKSLWRLIYNDALWGRVIKTKYFERSTMEEWFRS
jgi:hypothetical protein